MPTIKEIELKFLVDDFSVVRKKLLRMGAKLLWKGREENWFFNTKNKILKKSDAVLRIKIMGDTKLTLKEGKHIERGVRVANEHQVTIDNAQTMKSILEYIGFKRIFKYHKRREHWKLDNAYIELDTLDPTRKFVEIEASHAKLKALAQKLGLNLAKSTTKSYTQILKA